MAKKDVENTQTFDITNLVQTIDDAFSKLTVVEFSVRAKAFNDEQECLCNDKLDYTPTKLIVGNVGNSINDAIERALLASGNITRDQWERLKGIQYDVTDDDMDEDFDKTFDDDEDDFVQSQFSSYDDIQEVPEKVKEEKPKKASKKAPKEEPEDTEDFSEDPETTED